MVRKLEGLSRSLTNQTHEFTDMNKKKGQVGRMGGNVIMRFVCTNENSLLEKMLVAMTYSKLIT